MARTEVTQISYQTSLRKGLDEDGTDHAPFEVRIERVTEVIVYDGRGRNYRDSTRSSETLADLTIEQAGNLAEAIISDIVYAAGVGQDIVLRSVDDAPAEQ